MTPGPDAYDTALLSTYGRKFIVEPEGTRLSDNEKSAFRRLQPAGVMFRKRNFVENAPYPDWLLTFKALIDDITCTLNRKDIIFSIDHEGGRVIRPPLPITRFPYAATWTDHSALVAHAMATELKSLGINLSFSPVADIHSNPENPVINQRAFGRTAAKVSDYATQFYAALDASGIQGCAKHFPGHGDTTVDSHVELPVLNLSYDHMTARELIPFQALIASGIPAIMTGHLMLPQLDPEFPATLSPTILNDLLRNALNFEGVIISDGLGMDAIYNRLCAPETIWQAVNAGLDLFLVAGDSVSITDALTWAGVMRDGIRSGAIPQEALRQSLGRIAAFTCKLPQHPVEALNAETIEAHRTLASTLEQRNPWSTFDLNLPGFE